MKKNAFLVFLMISFLLNAQRLPILPLKGKALSHQDVGIRGFDRNDIAVILSSSSTWSPTQYHTVYIFKDNGTLDAYFKHDSFERINPSKETKERLFEFINSLELSDFLQYGQKDFELDIKTEQPPCRLTDNITHSLTLVQNGKENSYSYFAPKHFLENCNHPRINTTVLKKYVALLEMLQKTNQ